MPDLVWTGSRTLGSRCAAPGSQGRIQRLSLRRAYPTAVGDASQVKLDSVDNRDARTLTLRERVKAAAIDSALNPAWGNTATKVSSIQVPAGTYIYEGAAAAQSTQIGSVMGGGSQVYIPKVDPGWLVR